MILWLVQKGKLKLIITHHNGNNMATENQTANIKGIIQVIQTLQDKRPIQNCISQICQERIRVKKQPRKC